MVMTLQVGAATTPFPASAADAPPPRATAIDAPPAAPTGAYTPEPSYHPQLASLLASPSTAALPSVRGQNPQSIDIDLLRLNKDLYFDGGQGIAGWTPLTDAELTAAGIDPASLVDPSTGLQAAIYRGADGRLALVFAGSNDLQDWITNARQGVGFDDEQYDQAVALAQEASVAFGDSLVISGASLGGGLAATAALATDTPAVIFNAAGVHDNTLERLGLDPATARADAEAGLIRRYSIDGEILTDLQEDTPIVSALMPDAVGHPIVLDDPAPLSWWQKLIPGAEWKHSIDLHADPELLEAVTGQMEDLVAG
jgi:hypothetical protein